VIMPAALRIAVRLPGQAKPAAHQIETLHIFPADPFVDRRQWLEDRRIALFDPNEDTEKILRASDVPYEYVRHPSVLEGNDTPRMLVVGSGLSFYDHAQLGAILLRLAAQGHAILCLRPVEGEFPFPGGEEEYLPEPRDLRLAGVNIVPELDKRFDRPPWEGRGAASTMRCLVVANRAQVVGRFGTQESGWSWIDARFPGTGRFLISGFPIIESWEAGPAPRFLFLRILELLAEPNKERETER